MLSYLLQKRNKLYNNNNTRRGRKKEEKVKETKKEVRDGSNQEVGAGVGAAESSSQQDIF